MKKLQRFSARFTLRDEVIKILLESGARFGCNSACLHYLVNKDVQRPNVIWVQDLWTSKAAHEAALADPKLRPYIMQTIPLLQGIPGQTEIVPVGGKGL